MLTSSLRENTQNLRLLYVEDEPSLRESMTTMLQKLFKSVDAASNGQEGLELYKNNHYDLVITDIEMPVMTGLEMLEVIRELNADQVCVVISAYDDPSFLMSTIRVGVDGYLLKPLNTTLFFNVLKKVVSLIMLREENEQYKMKLETLVSEQSQEIQKKDDALIKTSLYDLKTGLHNHLYLNRMLEEDATFSLILLNIDNFSYINNVYGLEYGDKILQRVAQTLEKLLPSVLDICYFSGDEFVVVSRYTDVEYIQGILEQIYSFYHNYEFDIDPIRLKISFSAGVAIDKGKNVFLHAQIALKELRNVHRGHYQFYDPNSLYLQNQRNTVAWVKRIRNDLEEGRLHAYYQPLFNIHTKKVDKYECLARIIDGGEVIMPVKFIEAAKLSGMLSSITRIMIDQACKKFANTEYSFSINITQQDFQENYLIHFLQQKCERYNIDPSQIILEALETISHHDYQSALEQMLTLKNKGFKVSLDDFGVDDSNFSRLLELNPDFIKIDGSFILSVSSDIHSRRIVQTITEFAHKIGAKVVAEFVGDDDMLGIVENLGVDYAQGYLIGKPVPELLS